LDVAGAIGTEHPTFAYANGAKAIGIVDQASNKLVWGGMREFKVERLDQEGVYTQAFDQMDVVLSRGKQAGSTIGPQDLTGVRMKSENNGRASDGLRPIRRGRNHRLMPEMNAIENADREMDRAWNRGQFFDGM
jgi:hypothetical protein